MSITHTPKQYDVTTDKGKRIKNGVTEIMKLFDGKDVTEGLDVLINAMEVMINQVDDEDFRQAVLQSLNRFVIIQLMGKEEYEKTMTTITKLAEKEGLVSLMGDPTPDKLH